MLATIIVVIPPREYITPASIIVSNNTALRTSLILGLRDKGPGHVLPLQPAHVVNHLVVKVRVVISLIIARCGSDSRICRRNRQGSVSEGGGRATGEEGGGEGSRRRNRR